MTFSFKVTEGSIARPTSDSPVPGDLITPSGGLDALPSDNIFTVDEGYYIHIYAIESGTITGYGEHLMLTSEIKQPIDLGVSCMPDNIIVGNTVVHATDIATSTYKYKITGNSITDQFASTTVPGDAEDFSIDDSIAVEVDQYIHVWSMGTNGKLDGYGEHLVEESEIRAAANMGVAPNSGSTELTTVITLSDTPMDVETFRYSISESSIPSVISVLEEPTEYPILVSGVTEIVMESTQYIHIYGSKSGYVIAYGEREISEGDIAPADPLTVTTSIADNSYGTGADDDIVFTFSAPLLTIGGSEIDEAHVISNLTTSIPYTVTISEDYKTLTIDPDDPLKLGKLYSLVLTNQFKDADGAIFDGMTLNFTVGPKLDVDIADADDLVKYSGQVNGNYYIEVIPTGSPADVPANASDVINDVKAQTSSPYVHLDFVGYKMKAIDDNGLNEKIMGMLEPNKEHTAYIAFKDSEGLVYDQFDVISFTTAVYTPLLADLVFSDDDANDDHTVIALPNPPGGHSYVYRLTTIAEPYARPVEGTELAVIGTDWFTVSAGASIEVADHKHVNVAEIDGDGLVTKFSYGKAITKVENPFNTLCTYNFVGQSALEITHDLIATKESKVYYAMYSEDADLGGLTFSNVLNGTSGAISTGSFDLDTVGGPVKVEGVLNTAEAITYGDYQIALVPYVLSASNYYEVPIIAVISTTDNNVLYEMSLGHEANLPLSISPGTGVNDAPQNTQRILTTGEHMFKYEKMIGNNNSDHLKIAFIEQDLLKDKKYHEIRTFLKTEISGYSDQHRAKIFDYAVDDLERDVASLNPGNYLALLYNDYVGDPDDPLATYGDFSINPVEYAFFRTKDGAVNVKAHPIFEGKTTFGVFEFDNLVTPEIGEDFFISGVTAVEYDGDSVTTPSSDVISWSFDFDNFKTYATIKYADAEETITKGKSMTFRLNNAGLDVSNGNPVESLTIVNEVKDMLEGVNFGSYLKSQSINVANNYSMDINYVLISEALTGSIPTDHSTMASFLPGDSTKISHVIVNKNSSGSLDVSQLAYGTYKVFAYPLNYFDTSYISPVSGSSITIYKQSSSSSSSNDDDDDDEPTPDAPKPDSDILDSLNEDGNDDGDVDEQLDKFSALIDDIESPSDAKKSMDIIGKKIGKTGGDLAGLKKADKKKVVDSISRIIGNTEGLLEKLDDDADKVALVGQIMENTKGLISQLSQDEENGDDKKLVNQLNNSLVDLANKVIEEESKVVLGENGMVSLEDLLKPIEKGKKVKAQMSQILKDVGVDQQLKGLKSSLVVKIEGSNEASKSVGFPKEALESLAKEVDSLQIDFGNTGIQLDTKIMSNAKKTMTFSTEDIDVPQVKKPEGHEDKDLKVRQVEAFDGDAPVKAFSKPVKVTFDVGDFGFDPKDGNDLSDLMIMVFNEESGEWDPTGGVYDPITNAVTFYRIHMSKYTVVKNKKKFSDVENSWAKDEINNLLGKGIVDAKAEFKPNESVTREEFASWISRAYGLKETGHKATFVDIEKDNPYYDEIAHACEQGLLFGRTEEKFAPKEEITREEMATLVARAISNYNDVKVPNDGAIRYASLTDGNKTSDWAVDNVAMVIDLGIMEADENGNFNPQEPISKEAAADIFAKLYK